MSNVDVEALRGLLAEATPGPWRLEVDESWGDKDTSVVSDKGVICCDTQYYPTAVAPNDQALIAAAITALPAILDELTRLRAFRDSAACIRHNADGTWHVFIDGAIVPQDYICAKDALDDLCRELVVGVSQLPTKNFTMDADGRLVPVDTDRAGEE